MSDLDMVFFDAGETLVHPMPSFPQLFYSCCDDFGLTVDFNLLSSMGRCLMEDVEQKQKQGYTFTNDPEASRGFWLDFYRRLVIAMGYAAEDGLPEHLYSVFSRRSNYGTYDDAHETLEALRKMGIKLGLISNFESWLEDLLADAGLSGYFEVMVISGNEEFEKPHPAIYELALERAGAEAQRTLHIGDSPVSDYGGALEAGMHAILLDRWGRFPDFEGKKIVSLAEIPGLLPLK
ncbi:MAG: hypothetical protein A2Y75_04390 [Candidatus Solincola sediminis]|uniref:HAD family hydrolase n=1 Tax=Candidatus Solincola sediminis TaxID=1797199 RepID=A0A1F2WGH3_9ACTN|nr:MAG: hypothetical protein A2Y75_04390 [Candidatus Solincola sediminis]